MAEELSIEEWTKRYGQTSEPAAPAFGQIMPTAELEAARERGMDAGTAEAAGPIAGILGTAALGGIGAASGVVPAAARLALSPAGAGLTATGTALTKGASLPAAVSAGVVAAGTDKALGVTGKLAQMVLKSPTTRETLRHTLVRGAKVAAEEAAPAAKGVVEEIKKVAAPTLEDVTNRVIELYKAPNAKYEMSQIAEILREEFAPGQAGIGTGYFRRFAEQVIKKLPKGTP